MATGGLTGRAAAARLGGRPLAIDRLALGYLALTGLFALALGGRAGLWIAVLHASAAVGVSALSRFTPRTGLRGFARASYPVLVTPALYAELATLNRFLTERYFDDAVQVWERAVFGGQPSIELSAALPWLPLSEALHLGYVAYYAIVPLALIGVYRTRGFEALHRTAFAVAGAFFLSYLIFAVFPVAGPRYEFAPIGGRIADGTVYGVVHAILESGSSKGTAFPSSHIAASLAAVLAAGREDARWLWLLIVPEAALALGTVYGRFHYALDAVAGLLLGLMAWAVSPRAVAALSRGNPEPRPGIKTSDSEPAVEEERRGRA